MLESVSKPNLFIGSSKESIEIARAVNTQLSHYAQVTPWYAGAFPANEYTMESIEKQLDISDFAVFIFAPDDIIQHRGQLYFATRDNTLFEMGLFWGKLGRKRVFCILPEYIEPIVNKEELVQQYRLLSDLQGLTPLHYEHRTDSNWTAAVDIACGEISKYIQRSGKYINLQSELEHQKLQLQQKQKILHFLLIMNQESLQEEKREKFDDMCSALKVSFSIPLEYYVTGTAFWQAQDEGIKQIGGDVGQGFFYPYHVNEHKQAEEPRIAVVDAYKQQKWSYLKKSNRVAPTYMLCYPIGTQYVLTIHITGQISLKEQELWDILDANEELLDTIHYLIGGEWE